MFYIVLNAPYIFMYCTFCDAPVDAFMDVLRREVVSQVLVLVYLLTTSASLITVTASVPTTVVAPSVLPAIVGGGAAMMGRGEVQLQ